jgi:hypothetical protein
MSPRTRAENYALLLEHFEPHLVDGSLGPETHRYAAVAEGFFDERRVGALVILFQAEQEAFESLGDAVLDGYAPDGVYDLETGTKIDVHVSAPVVTRSEDQGISANWLSDN